MGAVAVPAIRDDYLFRRGGVHGGSRRHRGLGLQRRVACRPSARSQKVSSNDDGSEPFHMERVSRSGGQSTLAGHLQAARHRETPNCQVDSGFGSVFSS